MGIALNTHLYVALVSMAILTILILPIREHWISFHFIVFFPSLSIMLCSFQYIGPSHPLLSFIILVANAKRISFFYFFFWNFIDST